MKALVTGATGFIGSNVARALLKRGHRVQALIRRWSDTRNIDDLDIERFQGDIRDAKAVGEAVKECDAVFHTAALYSLWEPNSRLFYEINVVGTQCVLEACLEAKVERVVYTSTVAAVAPPREGVPSNEESWPSNDDLYGNYHRTKTLAERAALKLHEQGLPLVVVNPTLPIGPWDVKPTPTGKIILDFLRGRLPAYVDTGFNVVDVEDVAEGHVLAMEKGRIGQRYLLGNRNMTLREFLGELEAVSGKRAPNMKIPLWLALGTAYIDNVIQGSILGQEPLIPLEGVMAARHPMYVDCSKAVKELGMPQAPVDQAIAKAVTWFRDRGYV